jgi:glyoxylase-like metal-dependent hydrolase (beta-lactamase superfamily II)
MTKLEIHHSGIWQLSSIIIADSGECLLVDPGYFPRELDSLKASALNLGCPRGVIFTHGHWDHVVGWSSFGETQVYGSVGLRDAVVNGTAESARNLRNALEFDQRWYVERPSGVVWPSVMPLKEGDKISVGNAILRVLELPGHSSDGLGLLIEKERVLIVGDYLSPLEIPFVEDLEAYQNTLQRFLDNLPNITEIIPGHGPRLSPSHAREIALADLAYLETLSELAQTQDWQAALKMRLPRAANVPGMFDSHIQNCIACGIKKKTD